MRRDEARLRNVHIHGLDQSRESYERALSSERAKYAMATNNRDVLNPTRGAQASEDRRRNLAKAEESVRNLLKAYGGRPLPKKDVVDAVAFDLPCTQLTAQDYLDSLCSIHPRAPFVSHDVDGVAHISLKDPQLPNEDANLSASQQDSKQPPKKSSRTRSPRKAPKGGANA